MTTTRAIATTGIPMRKIFLNIILGLKTPPIPCHSMARGYVEGYARASKRVHGDVRGTLTYPSRTLLGTRRTSQVHSRRYDELRSAVGRQVTRRTLGQTSERVC